MQHAAAHQQAVLHHGVVVDGISPFTFWDYIWVLSIYVYICMYIYIYTDRYLSISININISISLSIYLSIYIYILYLDWRCIPLSKGLYPTYTSNFPIYIWVEMDVIWLVN